MKRPALGLLGAALLAAAFFTAGVSAVETPPPASGAAELRKTLDDALREFLDGRYEAAASGYRYIVSLGSTDPDASASLAVLARDSGKPEEAAAHWLKATLLDSRSSFLWNQRGWNYVSLGRFREARDAFRKASETAGPGHPDDAAEALFGLGLGESLDGNPKAALPPLQEAMNRSPYLRPAAAAELGRIQTRMRHWAQAIPFFTQSLEQDSLQSETARDLGEVYAETGQGKSAWQAFKFALDLDPEDSAALKSKAAIERNIPGRPEDSMRLVRLARPIYPQKIEGPIEKDMQSRPLRIGMFTGLDGRPHHLTRFYVMGSTATRLWDVKLQDDAVPPASAFRQWEVVYRVDSRVIEIRDPRGTVIYVTKQPFRFIPKVPGHTVLIKNPELADVRGIDLSDRELRGEVEVIPTPEGFHIVNEIPLEPYLFSVIGEALPPDSPPEAYKTMAVFTRSKVAELAAGGRKDPEQTDFCDSSRCLTYKGLTRERAVATQAVRETRGVTVRVPAGFALEYHLSCGWATAAEIQDRDPWGNVLRSAADLERLTHRYPDEKLFHQASALVPESWNRWVRILDADAIRARAERIKDVGALRSIQPLRRDRTGRVQTLLVVGARDSLQVSGDGAISELLSPGSLRSGLFTLQPIYAGRKLRKLVVWGAGTGHGRGLCIAGTLGQAHLGRDFVSILRHYFTPQVNILGYAPPPAAPRRRSVLRGAPPAAPAAPPVRRPRRRVHPPG
ncbi:MAG: hypothetical protein A2X36_01450 [Elusimicrobia bacterium GWA2_69_24]|nr:MAG: hypothetical protein A2X36_01450 [Elusimicrobia bacterium GWA2_69_24]HBL17128.1 hypothetical protein [Elusimicrobiota bacterium]